MRHYDERRRHYLLLILESSLAALAFLALESAAFREGAKLDLLASAGEKKSPDLDDMKEVVAR